MEIDARTHVGRRILLSLVVWLGAVVVASFSGWLGRISPLSPPIIAAFSIIVPSCAYFLSQSLRSYLANIGLRRLTALHTLRIAAVPIFFWYGRHRLLPNSFVQAAGWGDLLSGVLAILVVFVSARRVAYWMMHVFGVLDFVTAFAIGITLTLANPLSMHAITTLPMALIPFFAVGALATIHVIAFHLLLTSSEGVVDDTRYRNGIGGA